MIRVINLREKPWPFFAYVGRPFAGLNGHPLANPFPLKRGEDTIAARRAVVKRYTEWLDTLRDRDQLLAELWADTEGGRLPLACWCGRWPDQPHLLCHAVVLAKRLLERFGDADQ